MQKTINPFIIIFFCFFIFTQRTYSINQQGNTPEAWHFQKVEESGVGGYTGDLQLNLPILTIPGRNGLDLQITLGYKSGITSTQTATLVGLGWNLDIGSIYRQVRFGVDDGEWDACSNYAQFAENGLLTRQSNGDWNAIPSGLGTVTGGFDIPDSYFASFPGASAQIQIFEDGTNWFFSTTTFQAMEIEFTYNKDDNQGCGIQSFTIKNKDGIKYVYDHRRIVAVSNSTLANNLKFDTSGYDTEHIRFVYAWDLSKILSADYIDNDPEGCDENDYGSWIKINYGLNYNMIYSSGTIINHQGYGDLIGDLKEYRYQRYETSYIESIETQTHKAIFNVIKDRLDNPAIDWNIDEWHCGKLSSITLQTKNGDNISKVVFSYDYSLKKQQTADGHWDINNHWTAQSTNLTLRSIQEKGWNGSSWINKPATELTYEPRNPSIDFGNYNVTSNLDNYWKYYDYVVSGQEYPQAWSLSEIQYPSGVKITYGYEPHKFNRIKQGYHWYGQGSNYWQNPDEISGGCRVKSVTTDDGFGNMFTTNFEYPNASDTNENIVFAIPSRVSEQSYNYSTNLNAQPCVQYPWVKRINPDNSYRITKYTTIGTNYVNDNTHYTGYDPLYLVSFTTSESLQLAHYWYIHSGKDYDRLYMFPSYTWGYPIEMKEYSSSGGDPKRTETNSYSIIVTDIMDGIWDASINTTRGGWLRLDQKTITQDGANKIIEYKYNSANGLVEQIREENSSYSAGNSKVKMTFTDYAFNHYTGMSNKNILSQIAQQTVYEFQDSEFIPTDPEDLKTNYTDHARSSTVTTWKDNWDHGSGQWAAEITYLWIESSASSYSLPTFNQWTSGSPNAEWLLISKINERDQYSNIIKEEDANGNITKYYYGTNSNPFQNTTGNYLTGVQKVIDTAENPPDSGVRPGDDLFVEYQYNDLGQVTKIGDENGKFTSYEYDEFWRLDKLKNHDDNVLTEYDYYFSRDNHTNFDPIYPNSIITTTYFSVSLLGTFVTYYDGLGRELQTQIDESNDLIVSEKVYDALGRLAIETKPARYLNTLIGFQAGFIEASWNIGNIMSSSSYISDYYDTSPIEANAPDAGGYPYLQTEYYEDPLNRVHFSIPPGKSFRTHNIQYEYASNSANELGYDANELYETRTWDENGIKTEVMTDKLGNNIGQRVDPSGLNLTTKFIYDILGNLTKIIPPKASGSESSPYCTAMKYNTLGQLIEKNTPDADAQSEPDFKYNYDNNGNLRFIQDANGQIVYQKYDPFNRVIESGKFFGTFSETEPNTPAFPTTNHSVEIQYVYDQEPPWGIDLWPSDPLWFFHNLKGRLVAVQYRKTGSTSFGRTYYSYDNQGNVEWIKQDIPGVTDIKTIQYEYDRQGNITEQRYQTDYHDQFNIWYEYDHAGRLSKLFTDRETTQPSQTTASYSYWPTGQVKRMVLGENVQGVDYLYNIRDWMTQINHQNLGNPSQDPGGDSNDRFGEIIGYNNQSHIAGDSDFTFHQQFNGNISWLITNTHGLSPYMTGFTYHYDSAYRLLEADFGYYSGGWNQQSNNGYDVHIPENNGYDNNGNILELTRWDETGSSNPMNYSYFNNTNRLKNVGGDDFVYDRNGNLIQDPNKFITNDILYDFRNLPYKIEITGSGEIRNIYDANGNRVSKQILDNN